MCLSPFAFKSPSHSTSLSSSPLLSPPFPASHRPFNSSPLRELTRHRQRRRRWHLPLRPPLPQLRDPSRSWPRSSSSSSSSASSPPLTPHLWAATASPTTTMLVPVILWPPAPCAFTSIASITTGLSSLSRRRRHLLLQMTRSIRGTESRRGSSLRGPTPFTTEEQLHVNSWPSPAHAKAWVSYIIIF